MSTEIDEKVVSMRFDNSKFESNVKTSMSTLEKLKASLRFEGVEKGFDGIERASRSVRLSPLGEAVESVKVKFSALEIMATTALANITNSAVNAGVRLVKSLSIDNIASGWQKFADQTISTGTLVAQGFDMSEISEQVEQMSRFSDETSYNFTDMFDAVSKFTAAGNGLSDSAKAVEGIALAAALAGQNASVASRVTVQLSQAISSYMKAQDWISVTTANMDTKEFRQTILDTAVAMGTLKKNSDGTYRSLIKGLKNVKDFTIEQMPQSLTAGQWLTGDVQMAVYKKYASAVDDVFAYADKNGVIVSEAIREIGDAADAFGVKALKAGQEARTWADVMNATRLAVGSTWEKTFELIFGNYEEATDLFTNLSEALYNVFAEPRNAFNEVLEEWSTSFGGHERLVKAFWDIWEGLGTIIAPIKEAFREIFPAKTARDLSIITGKIAQFARSLSISEETAKKVKSIFKGLFSIFDLGKKTISAVIDALKPFGGLLSKIGEKLVDLAASAGDWISSFNENAQKTDFFKEKVQQIVDKLSSAARAIGDFAERSWEKLKEFGKKIAEFAELVRAKFNLPTIDELKNKFIELFDKIKTKISEVNLAPFFSNVSRIISSVITNIRTFFGALREKLEAPGVIDVKNILKDIWEIVSSLAGSAFRTVLDLLGQLLTAFKADDAKTFFEVLDEGFVATITGSFAIFVATITEGISEISWCLDGLQRDLNAKAFLNLGKGIAFFAASIFLLAAIDPDRLDASLGTMTVLIADLVGTMAILSKTMKDKSITTGLVKASAAMASLGTAVLLLAVSMKILSSLDSGQLNIALVGMTTALFELVLAVGILGKMDGDMKSAAKSMEKIAFAMILLAAAMKIIASMNPDELANALFGIGIGLGILVYALEKLPDDSGVKAAGVTKIATAMIILGAALKIFASIDLIDMFKALAAVAASLLVFTDTIEHLPADSSAKASGVLVLSAAMIVLGAALKILGSLNIDELIIAMVGMASSLTMMIYALDSVPPDSAKKASAILIFSAALVVLGGALAIIGGLSVGEAITAIAAIAAIFVVIGVAASVLETAIPTIMSLSGAIALFGAGCLAAGAGILLLATGLTALAGGIEVSAVGLVMALGAIISGVIAMQDKIIELVKTLIISAATALSETAPVVIEALLSLLDTALTSLIDHVPSIVLKVLELVDRVLIVLADKIPDIVISVVALFDAFFGALVEAVTQGDPAVRLEQLLLSVATIGAFLLALGALTSLTPKALMGVLGLGAVIAEVAIVIAAFGALSTIPGLSWLVEKGGDFLLIVGNAIGNFVGGILGGVAEGITSVLPAIGNDLSNFMANLEPFIDGASKINDATMSGVKTLAETIIILTAAELLDGIASWITGGSSFSKFGKELSKFAPYLKEYSDGVTGINSAAVTASADVIAALAACASDLPNSGGIVSWFTGDNKMSKFGKELSAFGPYLKSFSNSVTGLDTGAVTAASDAMGSVITFASNLPNSGGVVSWFTGDNTLAKFGEGLSEFGTYLYEYTNAVQGVHPAVVQDSIDAADALIAMADSIPNSGGLIEFFTGGSSLDQFGTNLVTLGASLRNYSSYASLIDHDAVKESVADLSSLILVLNHMSNLPNVNFALALETLAYEGVTAFTNEFENSTDRVRIAVNSFVEAASQAAKAKRTVFKDDGVLSAAQYILGLNSKRTATKTAAENLVSSATSGMRGKYSSFYEVGNYLITGFKIGLESKANNVYTAAENIARIAVSRMKNVLQERSPSKVTTKIGAFAGEGFVNGLMQYAEAAGNSGEEIANKSMGGLQQAIQALHNSVDENIDYNPVIRPVLDLSDIQSKASALANLIGSDRAVSVGNAMNSRLEAAYAGAAQNTPPTPVKYEFTQNNYSPKALSRMDIYRQTKNQLSAIERVVRK